jgi:hypothetical protein
MCKRAYANLSRSFLMAMPFNSPSGHCYLSGPWKSHQICMILLSLSFSFSRPLMHFMLPSVRSRLLFLGGFTWAFTQQFHPGSRSRMRSQRRFLNHDQVIYVINNQEKKN